MIFAIDFDGTIVDHEYPKIGKLKDNVKEVINKIHSKGNKIIIWTCRSDKITVDEMINFLVTEGIHFDEINNNVKNEQHFYPKPKIFAHIYIDDRNLFCENINWKKIEKYLIKKGILGE